MAARRSRSVGSEPGDVWVALATAPDEAVARRLARLAVEEGHAACANLVPGLLSVFRWKGALEEQSEILIVFKTTAAAYPGLGELVAREHPYQVPELVAVPVAAGLESYLQWVRDTTVKVDSPGMAL